MLSLIHIFKFIKVIYPIFLDLVLMVGIMSMRMMVALLF